MTVTAKGAKAMRSGANRAALAVVVMAIACATFAIVQNLRARRSADRLVTLRAERADHDRLVKDLLAAQRAADVPSRAADPVVASIDAPERADAPGAEASAAANWAELQENARIAAANRALGLFFRRRGITGNDAARITAQVAQHARIHSDLVNAAPAQVRTDPQHPAVVAWKAQIESEAARSRAELAGLLGPEGFQDYERYEMEKPHWQLVTAVASRLYESDTPLTATQAERLGGILIAHATDASGHVTRNFPNWDEVLREAARALAPAQIEMLETVREHDQLWRQMNRLRGQAARTKTIAEGGRTR